MQERFECPKCGEELTDVAVELHRLEKQHQELKELHDSILKRVFSDDELGKISDRIHHVSE
jgi:transcription initiation factor IIE alpha subunit